jgi:hypothetical protein
VLQDQFTMASLSKKDTPTYVNSPFVSLLRERMGPPVAIPQSVHQNFNQNV